MDSNKLYLFVKMKIHTKNRIIFNTSTKICIKIAPKTRLERKKRKNATKNAPKYVLMFAVTKKLSRI